MVDIGEGGALLDVESPPPLHQTVGCRLKEPAPTDWIKARVVRPGGFRQVALEFLSSWPFDFTLAAILGLNFDALFRDAGWR
ncbi:MAG: hypothetical protein JOZ53_24310 [Planctomycetaceae bacterium]|nr:hypothetical protein [Planctomycetaceae bacterium]